MKRLRMIMKVVLLIAIILRIAKPKMITQTLGEGILDLMPKVISMLV